MYALAPCTPEQVNTRVRTQVGPAEQPQPPRVRSGGEFTDRLELLEAAVQGQNVTALSEDVRDVMRSLGMDRSVKFDSGDCAFLLTCFIFTMMMTLPGLALFYGGLVRVQNVLSIVMQTFSIACLITVLWIAFGYSLCFSPGGNGLYGDHRNFWLLNVKMDSFHPDFPHVPEASFVLFQLSFAILTPALICGSFADRMRLGPMLVFMALWHLLVYCPMAHSMWTKFGFLHQLGILDFSGGNVVHVAAGFSGLVSSIVVGKRRGFGRDSFTAHNKLLSVMGASMLWVGWLSFNSGNTTRVGPQAAQAQLNTHVGAACGSLAWMFSEWVLKRRPSVFGIISGALAGLIAITPGAGFIDITGAVVSGAGAGALCYWTCQLKYLLSFDDALDSFGIHGPAAIWGGMMVGFFAQKEIGGTDGCFYGNCRQLALQLLGIVVSILWSSIATFIILKVVDTFMGLRVDESAEMLGLDMVMHGEKLGASSVSNSRSGHVPGQTDWLQQEIEESLHPNRYAYVELVYVY